MLSKVFLPLHRALLLVVIAVALSATGFAHRMPGLQDGALAFALANGAGASDFCGRTAGGDRATGLHCPACQITASADLPQPTDTLVGLGLSVHATVNARRETLAPCRIRDPAHTPRGPPAV